MSDVGVEKTYSTFEKILYIFIIPIVFTVILALSLFSLFDYDVKDTMLKYGREIPLVGQYLPKPVDENTTTIETSEGSATVSKKVDEFGVDYTKEIRGLNDKIALQESELKKAIRDIETKDKLISELKTSLKQRDEQLKAKSLTDKEYISKIKELATVYASMSASKAAPIVEKLSTEEAVLVLNQMPAGDKKNILQKMDPGRAAEISIMTKDAIPVKDQEIAALQARLNLQDPNSDVKIKVSKQDMASTYENMDPKVAAAVLSELLNQDANRVFSIMANLGPAARAKIIEEMTPQLAAKITSRIGE
jgi:flagellar motility protein MotE (MotC chaperone)